jgi:hypothetical protein
MWNFHETIVTLVLTAQSSFIRDMLIRSHKKLIVYNFWLTYIAIYGAEISRGE